MQDHQGMMMCSGTSLHSSRCFLYPGHVPPLTITTSMRRQLLSFNLDPGLSNPSSLSGSLWKKWTADCCSSNASTLDPCEHQQFSNNVISFLDSSSTPRLSVKCVFAGEFPPGQEKNNKNSDNGPSKEDVEF
jgi:hypothetical protein